MFPRPASLSASLPSKHLILSKETLNKLRGKPCFALREKQMWFMAVMICNIYYEDLMHIYTQSLLISHAGKKEHDKDGERIKTGAILLSVTIMRS